MKVITASSAGFCRGVSRAIARARELAEAYTDGPLIHNEQLMKKLHKEGISEIDDIQSVPPGSNLVIRAHGVPPARRKQLEDLGVNLVDATCPDVARIQGLIRKYARRGYDILVLGDKGHPEVVGLLGYADGNGRLIGSTRDIDSLPDMKQVCLVSQSTQFPGHFEKVAESVRRKFPRAVVLNTICPSTRQRQEDIVELAKKTDAIVVVGGKQSANTGRLAELASSLKPAFLIQTADQIDAKTFAQFETVGLTAGASTPDFIIEEALHRLESL